MVYADDVLVLGFEDNGPDPALRRATLQSLAPAGAQGLIVATDWTRMDARWLETLASLAQSRSRLICFGFGAGGYAALYIGRLLGAEAIFAANPGAAIDAADIEDLAALFADPDLSVEGQQLHILAGDDGHLADLALAASLQNAGAVVDLALTELPTVATPLALVQSGCLTTQLAAWMSGMPAPGFASLAVAWRGALAYNLEINAATANLDAAGTLHLCGRLTNRSTVPFDLATATLEQVRIGVRRRGLRPEDSVVQEARASFGASSLDPGHSAPFDLSLVDFRQDAGVLEFALVCEGRFWFDHLGFPLTRLEVNS